MMWERSPTPSLQRTQRSPTAQALFSVGSRHMPNSSENGAARAVGLLEVPQQHKVLGQSPI
eukprot:3504359-Amphidinium_carterae.1